MTYAEAHEKMFDRNYFGMMMVEAGEADAFITGTYSKYAETIQIAKEVIPVYAKDTNISEPCTS